MAEDPDGIGAAGEALEGARAQVPVAANLRVINRLPDDWETIDVEARGLTECVSLIEALVQVVEAARVELGVYLAWTAFKDVLTQVSPYFPGQFETLGHGSYNRNLGILRETVSARVYGADWRAQIDRMRRQSADRSNAPSSGRIPG